MTQTVGELLVNAKFTTYRWLVDPGHGWLVVPLSYVRALGIEQYISPSSFHDGDRLAYLEEDMDAAIFIFALYGERAREEFQSVYRYHETRKSFLPPFRFDIRDIDPRSGFDHSVALIKHLRERPNPGEPVTDFVFSTV